MSNWKSFLISKSSTYPLQKVQGVNCILNIINHKSIKMLLRPLRKIFILTLFLFANFIEAQDESNEKEIFISGQINLTNNGFSFIPLFSLGKPATTINLSVGGKRLSFDPQFRFDLDGMRPWSFLFIWHYKLIKKERFQLRLGSYFPAYAFTELDYSRNSRSVKILTPQRFFIWTTNLNYVINKNISVGLFYLNGKGLEKVDQTKQGNFISLRSYVQNINLSKSFNLSFNPEIYFLKIDSNQGYYVAQTFTIRHSKLPFSISTTMNKAINSNINAKPFDWNIGFNYNFKSSFQKK